MSRSLQTSAPLPRHGFRILRDLVHERTGLYFDDDKSDIFLDKLWPVIAGQELASPLEYYYLLKHDRAGMNEWRKVFDALTVQESFFWREMDQIRALVDRIVPQYFKDHPHSTLNIWSAACAAGEEPLTIAMALHDAGWFEREKIEIHASDASPRAVQSAQNGVYRERSFRNLPREFREKYFVRGDGLSRVSTDLHSRVRWRIANLMSDDDLAVMDPVTPPVIFCRNVFIYFSESAIRKTVRAFAQRMPRPGHLFVGTAESLLKVTTDFELQEIGNAFVYVRN